MRLAVCRGTAPADAGPRGAYNSLGGKQTPGVLMFGDPMARSPQRFTLGLIQMRCEPNVQANLDKAVARIQQAAQSGAEIICLQELFRSPYFCQREDPSLFDLAEPIPGPTSERLSQLAHE